MGLLDDMLRNSWLGGLTGILDQLNGAGLGYLAEHLPMLATSRT